jgi:hypothetical protein
MFFSGRNGALFQATGLVHPRLRRLLLPTELASDEALASFDRAHRRKGRGQLDGAA